jgi:LmbE family N-acetylglucosaminyl deacetylase
MNLTNSTAEIYVPDGTGADKALARTTHMGIGAHSDDVEIMAMDGILKCFGQKTEWFTSVCATDGAGSPRDGIYASYSDSDMRKVRKAEQKKAAVLGEYGAAVLLDYPSAMVKDPSSPGLASDIREICKAARPSVVYTHNPADKHDTHVAVMIRVVHALQDLAADIQPQKVYGVEVWRDLDWMPDADKVVFDVSAHENLSNALISVHDSQICGGKRYDLAAAGRRRANATYYASHGVDEATQLIYAVDLTPLMHEAKMDIREYIDRHMAGFRKDVAERIGKFI